MDSGRLDDLNLNPAAFLDQAAGCINAAKTAALVDGVRYQRVGDDAYWCQELFQKEEVIGYLGKMVDVTKAVTQQVTYQSNVECSFAEGLDANEAVRVFAKLPGWFKVATPLGSYDPDWIVVVATEAGDRLYFVVETKGTQLAEDLRRAERDRIRCGEKHFAAIARAPGEPEFRQETDAARFLQHATQRASSP